MLIKEIRVVSPLDIRPTYRVPASEVRILEDLVEMRGLEPADPGAGSWDRVGRPWFARWLIRGE